MAGHKSNLSQKDSAARGYPAYKLTKNTARSKMVSEARSLESQGELRIPEWP
jgi:hypothetical protein